MSKAVLSDLTFGGVSRILALPDAVANDQPATLGQLLAQGQGVAWKNEVDAASPAGTNITISAPGAAIDGVTMLAGHRFLAKDQTSAPENGIYVWASASTPAVRAVDMDAPTEFNAAVVPVKHGGTQNGDTSWRCTTADPTVGTTAISFTNFQTAAGAASEGSAGVIAIATQTEADTGTNDSKALTPLKAKTAAWMLHKYATDVGDGTATSYTIPHNLGTRDVNVYVRRNSGNYDEIFCDKNALTTNTVQLIFNTAPTSAQYRCIVVA